MTAPTTGLTQEQILVADLELARRLHAPLWSNWLAYSRELANDAMDYSEPIDDENEYTPGDYDLLYQAALVLSICAAPANDETAAALVSRTRHLRGQLELGYAVTDEVPAEPRR